ncbi:sensor histidine kinase [Gulosibacter molinativorax]|uniref:histidine kinase n=1 Tax=Gulosibacter molinativorax TaxID=256821 RepID=A0ABT7C8W4_9MICO|nr:HAMP domain-containing sensor histidine kinase [Gulosibacter molinativorax]MDJ1371643.1 HAMP domain-containing histidine kinase [Gulosibacter molinativorax]QUY61013.1 Two-component sensor kinase TcrY [Gulosibacter molinativorax]
MSQSPKPPKSEKSEKPARRPMTLRRKLVLSFVGLLALFAIVVGAFSVTALHRDQFDRLDDQLAQSLRAQFTNPPPDGNFGDAVGGSQHESRLGTLVLMALDGQVIRAEYTGEDGAVTTLTQSQAVAVVKQVEAAPKTVSVPGLGAMRVQSETLTDASGTRLVVIAGLDASDAQATTRNLMIVYAIVAAIAIALFALFASNLVSRALRPLGRVASTAVKVSARPLAAGEGTIPDRVPEVDTDPRTEVGQVGSALNHLLDSVEDALVAREQSERRLRQFVADASHELRTPLAAIRGYSELVQRGDANLDESQQRSLERINSASVRMTDLVEDLLLLARLDAGQQLRLDETDLTRIVLDAIADAQATHPDHEWVLDAEPEELLVHGDALRLHQVLANLLRNAGTHTPAGTTVTVSTRRDEGALEVSVTDNGPGIDPDVMPSIFGRFVRGDTARERGAEGSGGTGSTGLGLAISQAIATAHGGEIRAESEPGQTRFTLRLPGLGGA